MSAITEFLRSRYTDDRMALLDVDRALGEDRQHPLSVARRLRDIDAKWEIVARCETAANIAAEDGVANVIGRIHDAAVTLQWLTQEFADHPDCDPRWRVDRESEAATRVLTDDRQ